MGKRWPFMENLEAEVWVGWCKQYTGLQFLMKKLEGNQNYSLAFKIFEHKKGKKCSKA